MKYFSIPEFLSSIIIPDCFNEISKFRNSSAIHLSFFYLEFGRRFTMKTEAKTSIRRMDTHFRLTSRNTAGWRPTNSNNSNNNSNSNNNGILTLPTTRMPDLTEWIHRRDRWITATAIPE